MPLLADTATWVAVGTALGAAALALAATLVLIVLVLRRDRPAGEPLEAVEEADPGAALAEAREGTRVESTRARRLAEIATTMDLDAVLERTLAAAASTDGVDAAMAVIRQTEETPIVATVGMSAEEAGRQPVSSAPSGGARAVRISYRYDAGQEPSPDFGDRLISGGVAVPLREEHVGTIGTLAVFWRGDDRVPEDDQIAELEELAQTSAPAIRNAQEFREARQLADVDALTGVHNRRYFHETLERECARAHRYERGLALIILDVDDFKATNDRLGHLAGDDVLAAVAGRLRDAVRESDIACRVGGDEFAVILPEAGARDAEQLYRRIQFAVGSGASGPAERVRLSAGIAELRPEDDAVALFQQADEALYQAKELGKGQVQRAEAEAGPSDRALEPGAPT
jgi:diguanylate cyclase (GGDEF)-like protein